MYSVNDNAKSNTLPFETNIRKNRTHFRIFEFSNFQIQHHLLYLFQINGLESAWLYLERPLQRGGGVGLRRHRGVGDGGGLRQVQTKSRLLSKPFCVLNA